MSDHSTGASLGILRRVRAGLVPFAFVVAQLAQVFRIGRRACAGLVPLSYIMSSNHDDMSALTTSK